MKYILTTGGVMSGLGKGMTTSAVGVLMKSAGYNVTAIKIDPYLNIDAGTMSPFEHGEVFVLNDGGEVDLDLGNYERYLNLELKKENNITGGKIFNLILEKERKGEYLGKTVQYVPHFSNEVIEWILNVSKINTDPKFKKSPDICLIELGGTIGDIESMPFIEALSQLRMKVGENNFCHLHVTLIPTVNIGGEQKTKPTQRSIRDVRELGLNPNFLICRCKTSLDEDIKDKIASRCYMKKENIISCENQSNLYELPILLKNQKLDFKILDLLKLPQNKIDTNDIKYWDKWIKLVKKSKKARKSHIKVKIGIVGKYNGLKDSYMSILNAIEHSTIKYEIKAEIIWINSEDLKSNNISKLKSLDGILIPGGFGIRGVEGKIIAAKYARENKIPFLGICLGLQIAAIEFSRNVLKIPNSTSEEFIKDKSDINPNNLVVIYMPDYDNNNKGGTMRLGSKTSNIQNINSKVYSIYKTKKISERHRHRYEINPLFLNKFKNKALNPIAVNNDNGIRCEILEYEKHPFYIGVQFHPEFKSSPLKPSPIFNEFIFSMINK